MVRVTQHLNVISEPNPHCRRHFLQCCSRHAEIIEKYFSTVFNEKYLYSTASVECFVRKHFMVAEVRKILNMTSEHYLGLGAMFWSWQDCRVLIRLYLIILLGWIELGLFSLMPVVMIRST